MSDKSKSATSTPETDPSSIGNLSVEMGYVTLDELQEAVAIQQRRLPLGKILVEMGTLTEDELDDLLFEQRVRRGEIKDKSVITQHQRVKKHRGVAKIKDGLKEMQAETRRISDLYFVAAQSIKAWR